MFKCCFPNCSYETNERSLIHYHHIIPKELEGVDKKKNRIYLCPNHHNLIYVPEAKTGVHSRFTEDSIILKGGWLQSTNGHVLEYQKINGVTTYLEDKND